MKKFSLRRFLPFRFHRFIFYSRAVTSGHDLNTAAQPFRFRELTAADLPLFRRLVDEEALPAFKERFHRGERCFGTLEDERLVALSWLSLRGGLDERTYLRVDLEPGEVYSYHFLVDPEYRNRGISTALGPVKDSFLLELGMDRVTLAIGKKNYASRRVAQKLGNQPVKMIYLFSIFGKRFQFERRLSGALPKSGSEALTTRSKPE